MSPEHDNPNQLILDMVPEDVAEELSDPRFMFRKHNCRATYALGCRGPLCRMKERHKRRIDRDSTSSRIDTEREAELMIAAERHGIALKIWKLNKGRAVA